MRAYIRAPPNKKSAIVVMLESSLGICACAVYPEHLAARVPPHHALRRRRGDRGIQSFIFRNGWWWFWLPGHVTKLNRVRVTWYSSTVQHFVENATRWWRSGYAVAAVCFILVHVLAWGMSCQSCSSSSLFSIDPSSQQQMICCIFQSSFVVPFDNKRLRLTLSATEKGKHHYTRRWHVNVRLDGVSEAGIHHSFFCATLGRGGPAGWRVHLCLDYLESSRS